MYSPIHFNAEPYASPARVPSFFASHFPSLAFYPRLLTILIKAGLQAQKGEYTGDDWAMHSEDVTRALEDVGFHFIIEGTEHFRTLDTPCVFAANHMSTLETFVLPAIIQPWRDTTFVIKSSLYKYPFFKSILNKRRPIGVDRVNPRDDLKIILEEGCKRLEAGTSIIVFPQSTRYPDFDPVKFNTIAVKLAKRANVPVVPLALHTVGWSEGKLLSDFGPLYPRIPARFRFGPPLSISCTGKEEHAVVVDFIRSFLGECKG